ncbi:MAG: hypothetical protein ACJAS4_000089 [Bacteriovoracaceae bacterium]
MLKNSFNKGEVLELKHSRHVHQHFIPVLISSKFLRSFQCGQIDLAGFKNKTLYLFEVKSKPEAISTMQMKRLNLSLTLLCEVFNAQGKITILNNLPKD